MGCLKIMSKEKISVIVPVYNAEKYLEKCVNSIIIQTYRNIEILLIDDGSTDSSSKICDLLAKKDSRIKVFHLQNEGVSHARNIGIENSLGTWVCFVDSDDWLEENMIETLVSKLEEDTEIIMTNCVVEYDSKNFKVNILGDKEKKYDYKNKDELIMNILCRQMTSNRKKIINIGAPWGKLYNRKFLIDNQLMFIYGIKRMQDNLFNLYCIKKAKKILYVNDYIYHYRINDSSACYKYNNKVTEVFVPVLNEFHKFVFSSENSDEIKSAYYCRTVLIFAEMLKIGPFHYKNKKSIFDKLKEAKKIRKLEIFENIDEKKYRKTCNKKTKILLHFYNKKNYSFLYILNWLNEYTKKMAGRINNK